MPNIICNILEASSPHTISQLISTESNGEEFIDFDNFAPMPEKYSRKKEQTENISSPSLPSDFFNIAKEMMPGFTNWYTWRMKNWGVKSNAYSFAKFSPTRIHFDTSWYHPEAIVKTISQQFPNELFKVAYASEDIGRNMGLYSIRNGKIIEQANIEEDTVLSHNFSSYIVEGESLTERNKSILEIHKNHGISIDEEETKDLLHIIRASEEFHQAIRQEFPKFNFHNPFEWFAITERTVFE